MPLKKEKFGIFKMKMKCQLKDTRVVQEVILEHSEVYEIEYLTQKYPWDYMDWNVCFISSMSYIRGILKQPRKYLLLMNV